MSALASSSFAASPDGHILAADDRCPWCDQAIPHERFDEIHRRIQAKERERSAELERRLKDQVARDKALIEAKAKGDIELAQKAAVAAIENAKGEAARREVAARAEARKAAESAVAPKLAEAEQAKKVAEQQLQALRLAQEGTLSERLKEQREALEKANLEAVNAEKAKAFNNTLKLEEKLQEMQRQLQKKTSEELGEGAEVDLFEALKSEFPRDQITRVNKGAAGADIIHTVVHGEKVCGCIIYDSKNRNAWRNEYATKLRQDQLAAKADHAILSTAVFPAGARQLHIQDGVVVVNPARVIVLVQMLRKHMLQTYTLRLSANARDQKTVQLYDFITSERCSQLLDQFETVSEDMLDLEVKEKKAHDATWRRRGELIRSVERAHANFSVEIQRIIGAGDADGQHGQ